MASPRIEDDACHIADILAFHNIWISLLFTDIHHMVVNNNVKYYQIQKELVQDNRYIDLIISYQWQSYVALFTFNLTASFYFQVD